MDLQFHWLAGVWKTVIRLPMFPVIVLRLRKFPVCMSAIGKPPMHVFKLAAFPASFISPLIPRFLVHSYEQLIYRKGLRTIYRFYTRAVMERTHGEINDLEGSFCVSNDIPRLKVAVPNPKAVKVGY